jgi:DNA-binding NtrC family response regulator
LSARILVVEDERAIALALRGLLTKDGHEVVQASDAAQAMALLRAESFDLVLTDLSLGKKGSGMDVLAESRRVRPEAPVIMITAHGSEKIAVEAIKAGAEDYVPKPFDNDELRHVIGRALGRTRLAREHRMLLDRIEKAYGYGSLVGSGAGMERIFELIKKVAETDLTVLIRGESGTGKELVAQALHGRSGRAARPFVAVNCAAISRELVESELFGHEKGAFTGADARRLGRFEAAEGGTILLDEIGDMPLDTQAKVLRVLQERTLTRVGGDAVIAVDVRIVAATHRDLEAEVARGGFREDLYYRLKVVEAEIPPLRERIEDLPALCERFLAQLGERLGRTPRALGPSALSRLTQHAWPGNVRELRNVIERAAVMAGGEQIEVDDLALGEVDTTADVVTSGVSFADAKRRAMIAFEKRYLLEALRRHDGNVSRTAEAIGMVRQSLQQKIREHGLRAALEQT